MIALSSRGVAFSTSSLMTARVFDCGSLQAKPSSDDVFGLADDANKKSQFLAQRSGDEALTQHLFPERVYNLIFTVPADTLH